MAKVKISEWSATPANNTDIDGINIAEGCAPSGINDAIREMMSQVKDLYAGTSGDALAVAGGGTGSTTASAARTALGVAIGTDVLPVTNPSYTGTLTGGTGVVNLGSGQFYKDASGNVGVGTSSPSAKLHVFGNNGNFGTNAFFGLNASTAGVGIGNNASIGLIQGQATATSSTVADIALQANGGNLLVGTTTAGAEGLTVMKSAVGAAGVCWVENTRNVNGDWTYRSILGSNCNTGGSVHFAGTTGASTWYLLGNGTSSWSSDARLKKNIETTRDGYLEDLCQLRVVKYNWRNHEDTDPKELGLIAQEVEQVFPGLVMDQLAPAEDGETYKMVKGSVLPYMLLKAIQEQQAIITALTARVAALESSAT